MSMLLTKVINMKENYKPLLTLWFPSWSKNFELFEEIFEIVAFVRFLDFFHSVKKVSKQTIFFEIMCVSKRTLIILIRMLYCAAFSIANNFVILFFRSFVWFISGEGISSGVIFPGGSFLGGQFSGGQFSARGNFLRSNLTFLVMHCEWFKFNFLFRFSEQFCKSSINSRSIVQ